MTKLLSARIIDTASELQAWLELTDVGKVRYVTMNGEPVSFHLVEETLSDGSTVENIELVQLTE